MKSAGIRFTNSKQQKNCSLTFDEENFTGTYILLFIWKSINTRAVILIYKWYIKMEWRCSGHVKKYLWGSDLPIKKTKNSSLTFNEKCFYWNVYIIAIMYECCLLNKSSYKIYSALHLNTVAMLKNIRGDPIYQFIYKVL